MNRVIPPEQDAEFAAQMEEVLDLYARPYDAQTPLACMDEQPAPLIGETRVPVPAAPGRPARADYEYERKGTAAAFLFTEPLGSWRRVEAREHRTKRD